MRSNKYNLSSEELQKLRSVDFSTKPGFVKASDILDEQIGPKGSIKREEFETKAHTWYYGEILCDHRKEPGMTQD